MASTYKHARAEYVASILGLAVEYEIDELASWSVTDALEADHFEAIVRQAVTQRLVRSKSAEQSSTVRFDVETKRQLRQHIEEMKRIIETSDETPKRKLDLMKKLNVLAAEVDRGQARFEHVMAMSIEGAKTGGAVGDALKPLVDQFVRAMAAWHGHAPEQGQLPPPPKQIEDKTEEKLRKNGSKKSFDKQLDDEIPF